MLICIPTGKHKKNGSTNGLAFESAAEAAGVKGICTFDEFAKHVLGRQAAQGYKVTDNGWSLAPDIHEISTSVMQRNNNKSRTLSYWASHLLPKEP